jgi:dTDP-4-dehydrorhamnose reductase
MAKILVTGANGQVGRELQVLAAQRSDVQFIFTNRSLLDITDGDAVEKFFNEQQPDYCINCAAYTAVDKAETETDLAKAVNVDAVQHLATQCHKHSAPFIHFSTDYVYHNGLNRPLREDDPTEPKGIYAQTKLDGEKAALKAHDHSLIVRTSWVYSTFGHNFVKTMLRLGGERDRLTVVFDQIGSPTYARSLADAMLKVIQLHRMGTVSREKWHGIYHYSNEGVCSWYDFAKAAIDAKGLGCEILPIESKDFPTPAQRPPFSLLNKAKFKSAFGLTIPHWQDDLKRMLGRL